MHVCCRAASAPMAMAACATVEVALARLGCGQIVGRKGIVIVIDVVVVVVHASRG